MMAMGVLNNSCCLTNNLIRFLSILGAKVAHYAGNHLHKKIINTAQYGEFPSLLFWQKKISFWHYSYWWYRSGYERRIS